MLLQAILLGLVAMLGNAEYLFGTSLLSRPLVMGTLTGIVLGDVQTGVTLGATLELAFMGAFSIGASIPPKRTTPRPLTHTGRYTADCARWSVRRCATPSRRLWWRGIPVW